MARCDIKFNGGEFDGAEDKLGGLRDKLVNASNNEALVKFGDDYWRNPTNILITPVLAFDEPKFLVNAHHETESAPSNVGTFQAHDFTFTFKIEGEEAYLRTDTERAYPITSREMFLLIQIGIIATMKTAQALEE
jgi:hypothetical protein